MKYRYLGVIVTVLFLSAASAEATSVTGYTLIDEGVSSLEPNCQQATSNSKGMRFQNLSIEKYGIPGYQGIINVIKNEKVIDVIYPESDYIHSSMTGIAINDDGQIIGMYRNNERPNSSARSAFIWEKGTVQILAESSSGSGQAFMSNINNHGFAIGGVAVSYGFAWKSRQSYDLGRIGTGYVFPRCIGDDGIITGTALDSSFDSHLIKWIPLDDQGNYNNGYDSDYNTEYNNGFNNHYNNGYNNGYIAPY